MSGFLNVLKKHIKSAHLYQQSQTNNAKSRTNGDSQSKNRHFPLNQNQVHHTASVTKPALYVDKAGHGLNGKIAPAEFLLLAAK